MARIASTLTLACLSSAQTVSISGAFDATKPTYLIKDHRFLAYNIDTGSIYNGLDFTNAKLRNLVRQLGE